MNIADLNPDFIKLYFTKKEMPHNIRNRCALNLASANPTYHGIKLYLFRVFLRWNWLPLPVKQYVSLTAFKSKMKIPRNIVCTCTICRM